MFDVDHQHRLGVTKIAILIVLGLLLFLAFIQLTCRTPADDDAIIRSSSGLQKHDQFCMTLPRPTDFQLRYRSIGGNGSTMAISYYYSSNLSYREVGDFFISTLGGQGWTKTGQYDDEMTPVGKSVSFEKDNYRVVLEHVSARGASQPGEYSLYCAREYK